MRHFKTLLILVLAVPNAESAQSVTIINRTRDVFLTVWLRQEGQTTYEQVGRALWANNGIRIYVETMPFYVAVSKRDRSYSFIGPFDRDYLSKRAAQIEIIEKHVYETGTREVQVWCRMHRRWETRTIEYSVSKPIPYLRVTGLRDVSEGASAIRETEAIGDAALIPPNGTLQPQ